MTKATNKILNRIVKAIGGVFLLCIAYIVLLSTYSVRLESRISIGENISESIEIIGSSPDREGNLPVFCSEGNQYQGAEICASALNSCAVKYIEWKVGIDTWLVLGVDKNNHVCSKAVGDT